jgi:hypothetical protein
MGLRTFYINSALLLFFSLTVFPSESANSVRAEIDHLLHYIKSSGCIFIRNDMEVTAAEARSHIQNKYNYSRDRVKTTEDFIKYAATKSSLSGKPYRVQCSGRETGTAEWLYTELQRLRNNK